jgi:hypothetical protein
MARLYISQRRVDSWTSENKLEITGDRMTLVELNLSFRIQPAVRFLKVEGDENDPHDLLGKVKDQDELARMGADHMASSVIYVDTAYKVENGFVGDPMPRALPGSRAPWSPRDP